jgi:hypothetical protein
MEKTSLLGYFFYMVETVYIETTIPSYYYETRTDAKAVAWREITRDWWDSEHLKFDCYTSDFTIIELNKGNHPNKIQKSSMIEELPRLDYVEEIDEIIEIYIKNLVMPSDAHGDAAHLAMASYHGMNYLLTWNCKNLANANKYGHIQRINLKLGLTSPLIITPEQLFIGGNV